MNKIQERKRLIRQHAVVDYITFPGKTKNASGDKLAAKQVKAKFRIISGMSQKEIDAILSDDFFAGVDVTLNKKHLY